MTTPAQKRALANHRRRTKDMGLVRVEVRVPAEKAQLIRTLAETMRTDPQAEVAIRPSGRASAPPGRSLWDAMQDLPDVSAPEFDAAFDRPQDGWTFRKDGL